MRKPCLLRDDVEMRYSFSVLAFALVLGACGSTNDRAPAFRGGAGGDAAYGRGLQALDSGNIDDAHGYFVCAAEFGGGYEVAWYHAGATALTLAGRGGDDAEAYRESGEAYLTTSGEAGWGASQAALAEHYHAQGNTAEAVYWAMLYTNNVREISLGLTRMDSDTLTAIQNSATEEEFASAQLLASRFTPTRIPIGRPSEECREATVGNRERTRDERPRVIRPQRTEAPGQRRRDPNQPY